MGWPVPDRPLIKPGPHAADLDLRTAVRVRPNPDRVPNRLLCADPPARVVPPVSGSRLFLRWLNPGVVSYTHCCVFTCVHDKDRRRQTTSILTRLLYIPIWLLNIAPIAQQHNLFIYLFTDPEH